MIQLSIGVTSFAAEDPGTWEPLFRAARVADRAGVDRLVVSDHVVFGERLEEYGRPEIGGQAGGKQPTGPDGHWLEPLTTLSVLAGMTSRIRLGTNILVAALRRPAVLAKSTATLDVLSGGRLDLGVGVGWQREEYEAAGLDFDRRGRLLDHTLEVLPDALARAAGGLRLARAAVRGHPHDAEAAPAGRRADLGQRHHQPAGGPAPGPLRERVGSRGVPRPPTPSPGSPRCARCSPTPAAIPRASRSRARCEW